MVPDRDYFACADDEIADVTSDLTMVGGKVVYGAGDFAALDEDELAAGHAGLVAGAPFRRLWRLGRCRQRGRQRTGPQVGNELRMRQRLQHSWPQSRACLVWPAADRGSEIVLGRARLRLLGGVMRAHQQREPYWAHRARSVRSDRPKQQEGSMARFRTARKTNMIRGTVIAAVALSSLAPTARAQTYHEFFGPPTPLVFDAQGARHWCLYGYYGPYTPPLAPNNSNIVTCRGNPIIQPTATLNKKAG